MYPNALPQSVVLAPMEGVTDYALRSFLTSKFSYDYSVTEFFRISDSIPKIKTFKTHIPELQTRNEHHFRSPTQVQILGGNAHNMAESALHAVEAGATAIDINFGCPAPLVNRHDGGATLLKDPCRMYEIVSLVRTRVPEHIPVSAKIRLGWDNSEPALHNSKAVEDAGASWITVHARTKMQSYKPPVDWHKIGEIKAHLKIPVIANGDLWSLDDVIRCQAITGCTHYMLGRSALANPTLADQVRMFLFGDESLSLKKFSWSQFFNEYVEFNMKLIKNENYTLRRIKQWIALSKPAGTLSWAEPLLRTQSLSQLLTELKLLELSSLPRASNDVRSGNSIVNLAP